MKIYREKYIGSKVYSLPVKLVAIWVYSSKNICTILQKKISKQLYPVEKSFSVYEK